MEWLNYHHLRYFWTVAREGGVSKAAAKLRLSQPTVSAQVKRLEDALGQRLFERQGRALVLSDTGRLVFRYADEIFGLGREMLETLRGRPAGRPLQLTVGVANALPKLIVHRLLVPATALAEPVHLVCREDNLEKLVAELATHALDVLIADSPAPAHLRVKVFNHLLGESAIAFYAPAARAARLRRTFPRSLAGVPIALPTASTAVRRGLDEWFEREGIRPQIAGEFDDSALMKTVAQGAGLVFPAPSAIERDVCGLYRVRPVGLTSVRESYYAISAERRVKHPGVLAITNTGKQALFG
jgi:LysR family transcriptional activator of nhaA